MNKTVFVNVAYVALGISLGFVLFSGSAHREGGQSMEMGTRDAVDMAMTHAHQMLEVDTSLPVPTVSLEVREDSKDGVNLHVITEHYRFTPEQVNAMPVSGEGHAHIYVNGAKIARLYSEWFHIPSGMLREGENTIEVTLNANDHSEWVKDGKHISSQINILK